MSSLLYDHAGRPLGAQFITEATRKVRDPRRVEPLTPRGIEHTRIRVTLACLISAVEKGVRKPRVRHLWFPQDNVNRYELRDGNPPADVDRPKHLRGQSLVIDIGVIPADVWDAVKTQRKHARRAAAQPTRIIDVVSDPLVIQHVNRIQTKGLLPKA